MYFNKYNKWLGFTTLILDSISTYAFKSIENYQFYILPVAFLILPFCLKAVEIKLFGFCFLLWSVLEVYIFPVAFIDIGNSSIALSQLENDPNGLTLRAFSHYLQSEKASYAMVNRNLNQTNWIESRPNIDILVTGNSNWFKLIFQRNNRLVKYLATNLNNFNSSSNFLIYDSKYYLALFPKEILIPVEPYELSAGLISKMSIALSSNSSDNLLEELSKRAEAAKAARSYLGPWKSGVARSWAFFTEANYELLRTIETDSLELCGSIKKKYAAAAALTFSRTKQPELAAYIYNNAAFGRIICEKDKDKANKLLEKALKVSTEKETMEIFQKNLNAVRNF